MKVLHTKNGKLRISGEFTHDDLFRVASELAADYLPDMPLLTSPNMVKNFLTAKLRHRSREGFEVLYCDNQNRMIAAETLFEGTIDGCAVYPREVARQCLYHGANAVIFAHNHPTDNTVPSQADRSITQKLKQALALLDIRVLDHIIVSKVDTYSMAEHGDL